MNSLEFFEQLEEQVRVLDARVQEINSQIGKIKGLIIEYEFSHREELEEERKKSRDSKDIFQGHTPYFGMFDENDKK